MNGKQTPAIHHEYQEPIRIRIYYWLVLGILCIVHKMCIRVWVELTTNWTHYYFVASPEALLLHIQQDVSLMWDFWTMHKICEEGQSGRNPFQYSFHCCVIGYRSNNKTGVSLDDMTIIMTMTFSRDFDEIRTWDFYHNFGKCETIADRDNGRK